jgi:hypothetical protein
MTEPEPRIIGRDALVGQRSAVDAEASWPEVDLAIVQVDVTTTQPGRIRAARRDLDRDRRNRRFRACDGPPDYAITAWSTSSGMSKLA